MISLSFAETVTVAAILVFVGVWAGKVHTNINALKAFMEEVRADIKQILSKLTPKVVAGNSPKQLTDLGREVSETIGDKTFIDKLAQKHHNELRLKTRYQLQSFCDDLIMNEYRPENDIQTRMDDAAFEHGLDMHHVHLVVSVLLRDRIFDLPGKAPVN